LRRRPSWRTSRGPSRRTSSGPGSAECAMSPSFLVATAWHGATGAA